VESVAETLFAFLDGIDALFGPFVPSGLLRFLDFFELLLIVASFPESPTTLFRDFTPIANIL
jgi:hypothetical protein